MKEIDRIGHEVGATTCSLQVESMVGVIDYAITVPYNPQCMNKAVKKLIKETEYA